MKLMAVASPSKLTNISTRGSVETSDNVMIGGFIIVGTPEDSADKGAWAIVGRRAVLCSRNVGRSFFADIFRLNSHSSE